MILRYGYLILRFMKHKTYGHTFLEHFALFVSDILHSFNPCALFKYPINLQYSAIFTLFLELFVM